MTSDPMDQVQPQHQVRIKHSFRVQTKKAKLRWVDMDLVNENLELTRSSHSRNRTSSRSRISRKSCASAMPHYAARVRQRRAYSSSILVATVTVSFGVAPDGEDSPLPLLCCWPANEGLDTLAMMCALCLGVPCRLHGTALLVRSPSTLAMGS